MERIYPWTSAALFKQICEILKEKGHMPEKILEYALPTSLSFEITTDKFRLWPDYRCESKGLGTFKALDSSSEKMTLTLPKIPAKSKELKNK